jgi:nicotinamidase-related amidase
MSNLTLDPKTTALVVIDLQKGITGGQTAPYSPAEVVANTVRIAERFRSVGALVILVHVDTGRNGELFPRPLTDVQRPAMTASPDWAEIVPELGPRESDVVVTKHQPSAFFGTDLEIQLRRRGIQTIVLAGISTNVGVEATARTGFEHGFNLVFARDAMTARDGELHAVSVTKYFPTIGRVRTTEEVVAAMGAA